MIKKLDLTKSEIDKLKIAMLLYDIGNIMIPESIFSKSGPLTAEEKLQVQEHPVIAAREILKPISNIQDVIPTYNETFIEQMMRYSKTKSYLPTYN